MSHIKVVIFICSFFFSLMENTNILFSRKLENYNHLKIKKIKIGEQMRDIYIYIYQLLLMNKTCTRCVKQYANIMILIPSINSLKHNYN